MNKKGAEMALGTIIAIILGVVVLVFLIFGFSSGWNNMWSKITELDGGSSNVDDVVRGCEVACAQNSVSAFCSQNRTVRFPDKHVEWGSCDTLGKSGSAGVEGCSSVDCSGVTIIDYGSSSK